MTQNDMVRGLGTPRGTRLMARYVDELAGPRASESRFADGAQVRIEIPSVENPSALRAVVEEAQRHDVIVHRVSQGSGAMLLSKFELSEMARIGADEGMEVSLFVGPREEYGVGGGVRSPDGALLNGRLRGFDHLRYALEDVLRAIDVGIRGFLVADTGLMEVLSRMVADGEIPASIVWKISAVLAPSNAVTFRQLVALGGTTVNVPSDMSLTELSEIRALSGTPIDLYVEAPDSMGGMVRGNELAELVTVAAPLYAKFGLRNARAVYPAGRQVMDDVVNNVREKVRRAAIAVDILGDVAAHIVMSKPGAAGLGVPEP